jgi:hypothetical protein
MKRVALSITFAIVLALGVAGPAAANKNTAIVETECSNGETLQVKVNFHAGEKSEENAASPIVGGGSFKTTELRLFSGATEILKVTSNYPREATVTCTGEVFEPVAEATFDFIVRGVPRPQRSSA